VLYERLQRLQTANIGSADPNSRVVADAFLALINVLSCIDEDQAWILSNIRVDAGDESADGSAKRTRLESGVWAKTHRRQVLTLADIKAGYQAEVQRIGLLLNGGFFV
jgi:nuclear pore complex protein Nup160